MVYVVFLALLGLFNAVVAFSYGFLALLALSGFLFMIALLGVYLEMQDQKEAQQETHREAPFIEVKEEEGAEDYDGWEPVEGWRWLSFEDEGSQAEETLPEEKAHA
jgi:hypothetical protein